MATKVKTGVIDSGAITSALITDASITADDLHTTLDLTGKTVTVATATAGDNDTSVASTAFVSTAIANLADSAPSTLNTLNELAAALGDDASFSTTVTNSIATKLPLSGGTMTGTIAGFTSTGIDDNATSNAITIDSSENVGIGVNPSYGLHVADGKGFMVGPDNSHGTYISHTNENTINGSYGIDSDIGDIWINYKGYQNGTTRFRDFRVGNGKQDALIHVDGSSGSIGIGTDPAGISEPSGILHLYRNATMDVNLVGNPPELNFEDLGGTSGQKRSRLTGDGNKLSIQALSDDDQTVTHHFVDFRLDNGGIQFYGDFPDGDQNVAFGASAGAALTSTGNRNVLLGSRAGMGVTTGDHNVFIGSGTSGSIRAAGEITTTGVENVGIGVGALGDNVSGGYNVAIGHMAMYYNGENSSSNIALGVNAMLNGGGGGSNVALGINALKQVGTSSGDSNTAINFEALEDLTTGNHNIGIGYRAGMNLQDGSYNIIIGNNSHNTATAGNHNIVLGYGASTVTGNRNLIIGYDSGTNMTSGAGNTLINFSGDSYGIDIASKSNHTVIAGGDMKPAFHNYVHEDNPYGNVDVTHGGGTENYITCGGGATIPLFSGGNTFSGLFIINDFTRTGDVYFCMTGGGSISIISQTGSVLQTTSSPSSLQYGIYLSNLGVMFKNGTSTSFKFRILSFRTRSAQ